MSIETQGNLIAYGLVALIVFIGAVLVLEQDGRRPYRDLTNRERVWIGRAGLAAPIWPVTILIAFIIAITWFFRVLIKAARGRG